MRIKLVEERLELQKQHRQTEEGKEESRFALQKHIKSLDEGMDGRVYRPNGLTEQEIKVVEGG